MSKTVIKTNGLTKQYDGLNKVNDVVLNIKKGRVYGFLGPNGAGKTTTMKMLLGLTKPTNGSIEILGMPMNKEFKNKILTKVGNIIENPSYYGHLTGQENIELIERMLELPEGSGLEMLKLVSLEDAKDKKVNDYSLGMKQRLAIAMALVRNPEVLILDEPTNGLDPAGTRQIRELIIDLAHERGITVMVSSHLLSEIEKIADDIGIINKGNMVFEGTADELDKIRKNQTIIRTNNNGIGVQLLQELDPKIVKDSIILDNLDDLRRAAVVKTLVLNGLKIYSVVEQKKSLEDLFLDLTGGK